MKTNRVKQSKVTKETVESILDGIDIEKEVK
jgi:hypothetical protein